ncbi:MAG: hypothetical protein A2Z52_01895 [Candidatus Moranbacteria bacterium RBG_19FT_COMBO_42_6]|nr:MAG: hypothetical protein A2Z52_01895 [Candidatus Moranbacteria bacterium RBG_19FT_COMBO_42_6]
MNFQGLKFEIGFWHPFGPHAGESAEDIVKRKQSEIEKNGWTLWSFQFRRSLGLWYKEIKKAKPNNILVFCSEGAGAKDTKGERKYCSYYIPVGETTPREVPLGINVPHPMGKKKKGSAFIVKKIICPAPINYETVPIEWLRNGKWQTTNLPTRPEYLIKIGQGQPMRKFRAILELQAPYLAEVGIR